MKSFSRYLVLCLALVFCLASAGKIYASPPDASTGFIDVTADPYYADGSDERDDTDAIQHAITDLSKLSPSGGVLYFPKGIYRVGEPEDDPDNWPGFLLPQGITIQGTNSVYNGNCQILLTDEDMDNGKVLFRIAGNSPNIVIQNITLVGKEGRPDQLQTGQVAIRATGESGQFAYGARFSNLTIMRFHKGISFEESPATNYNWQYTLIKLDRVNFWEVDTSVHINTINSDWEMTSCSFAAYKDGVAIDLVRSGFLSIMDSQGGGGQAPAGTPPGGTLAADTFIWVRGAAGNSHGNITLQNLQSEGFRSALKIDLQDYTYPITLINCGFGDLVQIRANCVFVSVGNTYRANTVRTVPPPAAGPPENYPGATDALIYSQGDNFQAVDNRNRDCATNIDAECPLDFMLNNYHPTTPYNNTLVMRAGEKRVDVGRPARFTRPVGIGNVDAPENGINNATNSVLLNLASGDPTTVPLRIGGSLLDENGAEYCSSCYYEIRRQMTYANPDDGTIGYLSFTGKQPGYAGFKFNGSIVPITNGVGDLGSSGLKWNKVWAINAVMGDAILSDKKTGQELYRIHEDVNNIYFEDIRTGKELMRLDKDGNLFVAGRIIQGASQPARKRVTRTRSHSRRKRS